MRRRAQAAINNPTYNEFYDFRQFRSIVQKLLRYRISKKARNHLRRIRFGTNFPSYLLCGLFGLEFSEQLIEEYEKSRKRSVLYVDRRLKLLLDKTAYWISPCLIDRRLDPERRVIINQLFKRVVNKNFIPPKIFRSTLSSSKPAPRNVPYRVQLSSLKKNCSSNRPIATCNYQHKEWRPFRDFGHARNGAITRAPTRSFSTDSRKRHQYSKYDCAHSHRPNSEYTKGGYKKFSNIDNNKIVAQGSKSTESYQMTIKKPFDKKRPPRYSNFDQLNLRLLGPRGKFLLRRRRFKLRFRRYSNSTRRLPWWRRQLISTFLKRRTLSYFVKLQRGNPTLRRRTSHLSKQLLINRRCQKLRTPRGYLRYAGWQTIRVQQCARSFITSWLLRPVSFLKRPLLEKRSKWWELGVYDTRRLVYAPLYHQFFNRRRGGYFQSLNNNILRPHSLRQYRKSTIRRFWRFRIRRFIFVRRFRRRFRAVRRKYFKYQSTWSSSLYPATRPLLKRFFNISRRRVVKLNVPLFLTKKDNDFIRTGRTRVHSYGPRHKFSKRDKSNYIARVKLGLQVRPTLPADFKILSRNLGLYGGAFSFSYKVKISTRLIGTLPYVIRSVAIKAYKDKIFRSRQRIWEVKGWIPKVQEIFRSKWKRRKLLIRNKRRRAYPVLVKNFLAEGLFLKIGCNGTQKTLSGINRAYRVNFPSSRLDRLSFFEYLNKVNNFIHLNQGNVRFQPVVEEFRPFLCSLRRYRLGPNQTHPFGDVLPYWRRAEFQFANSVMPPKCNTELTFLPRSFLN